MTTAKRNAGRKSRAVNRVSGSVRTSDGHVLAGAVVKAFDQDVGREEFLGEITTDKEGIYKITYTAAQFRRTGKEIGWHLPAPARAGQR